MFQRRTQLSLKPSGTEQNVRQFSENTITSFWKPMIFSGQALLRLRWGQKINSEAIKKQKSKHLKKVLTCFEQSTASLVWVKFSFLCFQHFLWTHFIQEFTSDTRLLFTRCSNSSSYLEICIARWRNVDVDTLEVNGLNSRVNNVFIADLFWRLCINDGNGFEWKVRVFTVFDQPILFMFSNGVFLFSQCNGSKAFSLKTWNISYKFRYEANWKIFWKSVHCRSHLLGQNFASSGCGKCLLRDEDHSGSRLHSFPGSCYLYSGTSPERFRRSPESTGLAGSWESRQDVLKRLICGFVSY